jgi:two-component system, LuxR family, response regulator FixJ
MEKQRELPVNHLIVVVDDDAAVRNSLKFSLEIEGFAVRVYATGADLLNTADLAGCACLVVDQNMPGMSGLDLVAELRGRRAWVPAILTTSHPSAAVRNRAAHAGISIVEKPFLGNRLIDGIHHAIAPTPTR